MAAPAGLLRVNYDQLRQREHERRMRQLSVLTFAAVVLLTIFAGLAVYSEIQRRTAQKREIEALHANRLYRAQLHEASLSDLATARNLIGKGNWRHGIAYLNRALKYDLQNRLRS